MTDHHCFGLFHLCVILAIAMASPAVVADDTMLVLKDLSARANQGDSDALFQLAEHYEQGDRIEQDLPRAAALYRHAAERGHAIAQYRLGLALTFGLGIEKNRVEGFVWLTRSEHRSQETQALAGALLALISTEIDAKTKSEALARAAGFQPIDGPLTQDSATLVSADASVDDAEPRLTDVLTRITQHVSGSICGPIRTHVEESGLINADVVVKQTPDGPKATIDDLDEEVDLHLTSVEPSICATFGMLMRQGEDRSMQLALRNQSGEIAEVFRESDNIVIHVPPLEEPRYLTIDYYVHDGVVLHLLPNADQANNFLPAGQARTLGKPGEGGPEWQVSPPYGNDLIVMHASLKPLMMDDRPMVEDTEGYLKILGAVLNERRDGQDVRTTYQIVRTSPR